MSRFRVRITIIVILISTVACQLFSPAKPLPPTQEVDKKSLQPTEPEQTSISNSTNDENEVTTSLKTPTPTQETKQNSLQSVPPEQTISASTTTNDVGVATFEDSISDNDLSVEFQDKKTRNGISGMEVWFISNGPNVLVIASDPSGEYATSVKELSYEQLASSSASNKMAAHSKSMSLATVILLAKFLESYQTFSEWRSYISQFPELKDWRTGEVTLCMSPIQLGKGTNLIVDAVVGKFLPKFKGNKILEGLMLVLEESFVDETINALSESITQETKPVLYKVTLFSFNGDVPKLLHFDGLCLDWLDQNDPQSTMDWFMYGLNNQDMYALSAITTSDDLLYAYYIEGGQWVSNQTYLGHLASRLSSEPRCDGYSPDGYGIQIWISGWSPLWEMTEMCYAGHCGGADWESDVTGFLLDDRDGDWSIRAMYLNVPARYYFIDNYQLKPCSMPYSSALESTPEPTATAKVVSCPGAPPQQLDISQRGYVCTKSDSVIVRESPNRSSGSVTHISPGTEFSIIDGPKCANDWSWWKIQTDDGITGWMAEGGDQIDPYFICPIP